MVGKELDLGIDNGETKMTISIIDKNGQLSQTYIVTSMSRIRSIVSMYVCIFR